tara:strand:- start:8883 stop:9083 length:201 start_codon:yes stop_codon:yes gene_type:complete
MLSDALPKRVARCSSHRSPPRANRFVEAIHVTKHSCPDVVPNFVTSNLSRSDVNFNVDTASEDCPK